MLKESNSMERAFTDATINEKQFAAAYEQADPKLQSLLIAGARAHCEHLFVQYIRRVISQSLMLARRSGKPSIMADIQAYLNVIQHQLPDNLESVKVDGYPLWALLYHCLRCGQLTAAAEIAQAALQQGAKIHVLAQCLEKKANGRQ